MRVPPPPRHLFTLARTPVQADISAPLHAAGTFGLCWLLVAERYPERARMARLPLAGLGALLLGGANLIHSLGHIISARAAQAPVDGLLINAVQWTTVYRDHSIPPEAHIGRAIGGPLASLAALVAARAIRPLMPAGPLGRDLLDIFLAGNALIGGAAMLPLTSSDGGSLLKWSVYARTGDFDRARWAVRRAGLGMSVLLGALAAIAGLLCRRMTGMVLAACSLVSALESLRRD